MGADLHVERGLRRGVQSGPHDLSKPLDGIARAAQGPCWSGRGDDRAFGEPGARPGHPADASQDHLSRRRLGRRLPRIEIGGSWARAVLDIEQHGRQIDARNAVDQRVVRL